MLHYEPDFTTIDGVTDFLTRKGRTDWAGAETQMTSLRLPKMTHLRLKKLAENSETTISDVIRLLLDASLEEMKPKLEAKGVDLDEYVKVWASELRAAARGERA